MTQLYTVKIQMKKLVSRFDAKGKLIEDRTELIEVTHTDMPHSTAMMYMRTTEPGLCQIIKQEGTAPAGKSRVTFNSDKRYEKRADKAAPKPATSKPTAAEKRQEAARTGNLAAAINEAS